MRLSRRQALKTLVAGAVATAIPKSVFADDRLEVILDVYVSDLPGDKVSESYNSAGHGQWPQIFDRVKEFYSEHDIDIRVRFKKDGEQTALRNDHIAVEYTTLDRIFGLPSWDRVFELGGPDLVERAKGLVAQRMEETGTDYETAEKDLLQEFCDSIKSKLSSKLTGIASKYAHKARVFPQENIQDDQERINTYATAICHEVGHALGLEHSAELVLIEGQKKMRFQYAENNFMTPAQENEQERKFDITMHPEQRDQIKKYIACGSK